MPQAANCATESRLAADLPPDDLFTEHLSL